MKTRHVLNLIIINYHKWHFKVKWAITVILIKVKGWDFSCVCVRSVVFTEKWRCLSSDLLLLRLSTGSSPGSTCCNTFTCTPWPTCSRCVCAHRHIHILTHSADSDLDGDMNWQWYEVCVVVACGCFCWLEQQWPLYIGDNNRTQTWLPPLM